MDEIKSFEFKVKNKKFKCQKITGGNYIIKPFMETIRLNEIMDAVQEQTPYRVVNINEKISRNSKNQISHKYYLAIVEPKVQ
ncbi:hypothetical protein EGQ24_00940 [bacterium]|nr:hypothetical protein [bacterium]